MSNIAYSCSTLVLFHCLDMNRWLEIKTKSGWMERDPTKVSSFFYWLLKFSGCVLWAKINIIIVSTVDVYSKNVLTLTLWTFCISTVGAVSGMLLKIINSLESREAAHLYRTGFQILFRNMYFSIMDEE